MPEIHSALIPKMDAVGLLHTALLRSDGSAVAIGQNANGQCNIPPLDEGTVYIQMSAGNSYAVLLRCDGNAVAIGLNNWAQCDILSPKVRNLLPWQYGYV